MKSEYVPSNQYVPWSIQFRVFGRIEAYFMQLLFVSLNNFCTKNKYYCLPSYASLTPINIFQYLSAPNNTQWFNYQIILLPHHLNQHKPTNTNAQMYQHTKAPILIHTNTNTTQQHIPTSLNTKHHRVTTMNIYQNTNNY